MNPRKRPAETQEEAWVADEDRFVLQQSKKKAALRVRAGRAKPIDYLAVSLGAIDANRGGFEEEDDDNNAAVVSPEGVFERLGDEELEELEKGIDTYLALEKQRNSRDYWHTMKLVCNDRRKAALGHGPSARGLSSVAPELDRVLAPKTLQELEALEKQVKHKLRTDDSIDVDYWENLLKRLSVHKAKAKLRQVSLEIVGARLATLRKQQVHAAAELRLLVQRSVAGAQDEDGALGDSTTPFDPEPSLKLTQEDKSLTVVEESSFMAQLLKDRQAVRKAGFIPAKHPTAGQPHIQDGSGTVARDTGNVNVSAYDREVARGVDDNEEIFATEEDVTSSRKPDWANKYPPRKPRHFNRVQMGYEWNKYNQTHYDQDNPPPKVVQGYRFNVFYPDLVDKTKAPTYRIQRENGRKRGQSFAPAGEDDTCLIRFIAGPPYEDIAFRIVDREWDYSAKRERGFKSTFDKVRYCGYLCTLLARSS